MTGQAVLGMIIGEDEMDIVPPCKRSRTAFRILDGTDEVVGQRCVAELFEAGALSMGRTWNLRKSTPASRDSARRSAKLPPSWTSDTIPVYGLEVSQSSVETCSARQKIRVRCLYPCSQLFQIIAPGPFLVRVTSARPLHRRSVRAGGCGRFRRFFTRSQRFGIGCACCWNRPWRSSG